MTEYSAVMMNAFGTPWAHMVRGEGIHLWDDTGKRYVDLLGGIAVNALGYGHPALIEAVTTQLSTLGHVSNYFSTDPQVKLAATLSDLYESETGLPAKVFFANSGTEANEAALKIAWLRKPGRIIALTHSFHGRSLGALSVTHKPAIREPFPQIGDVEFVDAEVESFEDLTGGVSAIILETIQGEAGVIPLKDDVLKAARRAADRLGALLIVDEVQTGMRRCGPWFAHTPVITADLVTLAKGLGGGIPIGAVLATGAAGDVLSPGSHGSTFGGNPVACAAALAVIAELSALGDHVETTGEWMTSVLDAAGINVRGRGMLLGLEVADAPRLVEELREAGIIVQAPNDTTLRLAPALNARREELEQPLAEICRMTNRRRA